MTKTTILITFLTVSTALFADFIGYRRIGTKKQKGVFVQPTSVRKFALFEKRALLDLRGRSTHRALSSSRIKQKRLGRTSRSVPRATLASPGIPTSFSIPKPTLPPIPSGGSPPVTISDKKIAELLSLSAPEVPSLEPLNIEQLLTVNAARGSSIGAIVGGAAAGVGGSSSGGGGSGGGAGGKSHNGGGIGQGMFDRFKDNYIDGNHESQNNNGNRNGGNGNDGSSAPPGAQPGIPDDFDPSKYSKTTQNIIEATAKYNPNEQFIVYESIDGGRPVQKNLLSSDMDDSTIAHELLHGIDFAQSQGNQSAFYDSSTGKFTYLIEPPFDKFHVAEFIPELLKGMPGSKNQGRFSTYFGDNNTPTNALYVLEENNAYITGGIAGVESVKEGKWKWGSRDAVSGVLEFTVYSFALAKAAKNHPSYWNSANGKALRKHLVYQTKRAMRTYNAGKNNGYFGNSAQETYYRRLTTSNDPQIVAFRNFMSSVLDSEQPGLSKRLFPEFDRSSVARR